MARPNVESHYGAFIVGRDLVQCDYDYPAAAERCGWSLRRVQMRTVDGEPRAITLERRPKRGSKNCCDHVSTDGTVACRDCGLTASDFISSAAEYLGSLC